MAAITLQNKNDGSLVVVDTFLERLKRMRKRVSAWCRAMENHFDDYLVVMVTLTYSPDAVWEANQIRDFMLKIRKWAVDPKTKESRLMAYAWVAELGSKNGRLHYHVLLVLRKGDMVPFPDQNGWWPFGWSKVEQARTIWYIVKYLAKGSHEWRGRMHLQGARCGPDGFPVRLRLYGVVIYSCMSLDDIERNEFRCTAWKRGVKDEVLKHVDVSESWDSVRAYPVRGGGWMVESFRGVSFLESSYVMMREAGERVASAWWFTLTELGTAITYFSEKFNQWRKVELPLGVVLGSFNISDPLVFFLEGTSIEVSLDLDDCAVLSYL